MTQPWAAERTVDVALARRLIRAQVPEVAAERVELLGEGWDNLVYRVDAEWVFRFPRRQMGADLLETECAVLPRLAGRLPLPVPELRFAGRPTGDYPWPFAGYGFLPGRPALNLSRRGALAAPLGGFLAALHGLDPGTFRALEVPGDTLGRLDFEKRLPQARERIRELAARGLLDRGERFEELMQSTPRDTQPMRLVHGDLYALHLLVDEAGALQGILDWGDTHLGDPACDLMVVYSFLPASARPAFFEAYGSCDDATRRVARFRALHHTATVALYAHETGLEPLLRESLSALERVAG